MIRPIKDDLIALESNQFSGFYLRAMDIVGDEQLELSKTTKEAVKAQTDDPWAWFKLIPIKDSIFALESAKFPGYFVQDLSVPFGTPKSPLKLRQEDDILTDTDQKVWAHF